LRLAAHAGHSKLVKLILNAPAFNLSPNAENTDGESALTMAIKKRGFEGTLRELATGGALLPKGRKKGLERYAIDHHWNRIAGFVSIMTEAGQIGDAVVNYSMDETMTAEYMRYLYSQAKKSTRYDEFKDSYLPLFLGKGPTILKDLIEELLESGVKPNIEQLTAHCYPKRADTTYETCMEYLELAQLLIKYNAELLHVKNDKGETGLYLAVKRESKPHLKWFLEQPNIDIEAENEVGATPLWSACYRGLGSFIEILLDHGADITHQNENGNIPIYGACERGPREVAELLISRGSPIEHYNNNGDTLILIACRNGQTDVVECLLEYASEAYVTHVAEIDDFNAAMACAEAGYGECIKVLHRYLFDLGAKTPIDNAKVLCGATAMHIAAYYGKTEAIVALLECGADPNTIDMHGCTPLHMAVIQGYVPAIMLLRNVSDLTVKDCVGNTAMAYCRNRPDIRAQLVDPALDSLMELARGCYVRGEHARAVAMLQAHSGVFGRQRFLNIYDHNGKSPVLEATLHGDYPLVRLLVDLGARTDVSDIYGMYPLTWAKHNRNQRMVALLDACTPNNVKEKVSLQLSILQKHNTGPNTSILFLGKPVGEYVQMTDSGLVSRMAHIPPVPSPIDESTKAFAKELPMLRCSNNAIVQYFHDPRFEALQTTRFLWNAKAFTVSVCANQHYLVPSNVLAIAMYTNNPVVPEVINSVLETQAWNANNETVKNYSSVLMQGLRALPFYKGEVFAGLEAVNRDQYRVGKEFTWNRFTSFSTLWRVAMEGTPSFTTKSRKGVIFAIRSKTGRLVNMCSQYGFDSELMFMPYTKFRVYDWFHGDPVALGQANIRKHSYHVRDESASWMTTEQMVTSDKALIIAVEEIA
jgi:ankyrin repeat protein